MSTKPAKNHNPLPTSPTIWETTPQKQRQQLAHLLAQLLYKRVSQTALFPPTPQEPSHEHPQQNQ